VSTMVVEKSSKTRRAVAGRLRAARVKKRPSFTDIVGEDGARAYMDEKRSTDRAAARKDGHRVATSEAQPVSN
jgi:hypothetical protein